MAPKIETPQQQLERLRQDLAVLRLSHTRQHLEAYLEWAERESPAVRDLLARIFGEEAEQKLQSRAQRRLSTCGVREHKSLATFDWKFQSTLDKAQILELAHMQFVHRADDLLFTGNPGTGKSHILQALTVCACHHQISVRYTRGVDLLNELYAGLADNTYLQRLKRWASPALLVIDDVGLGQVKKQPNEPTAAHMLFDLLDRRHGRLSTAIASNIELSQWGRYLGDTALAGAILDRVAMRAIRVTIDGPSYREHIAVQRAQERNKKGKKTRRRKTHETEHTEPTPVRDDDHPAP